MNLFYSSSILGAAVVSAADLEARDDIHHPNLLRLLQAATVLKVPILPLTWDPAFEALGLDGATSRVNQSPLNAALEFAYKRFAPESNDNYTTQEAFRKMQYDAMIAELTILSCPTIRRHENIVTFVGMCFEVLSSGEVLPVIVFKKAEHGDLSVFLAENLPLDASSLTEICGEVAKGIQIMHSCGKLCPFFVRLDHVLYQRSLTSREHP
jgi:Protein tyrosine and serine/threonine kinase